MVLVGARGRQDKWSGVLGVTETGQPFTFNKREKTSTVLRVSLCPFFPQKQYGTEPTIHDSPTRETRQETFTTNFKTGVVEPYLLTTLPGLPNQIFVSGWGEKSHRIVLLPTFPIIKKLLLKKKEINRTSVKSVNHVKQISRP